MSSPELSINSEQLLAHPDFEPPGQEHNEAKAPT